MFALAAHVSAPVQFLSPRLNMQLQPPVSKRRSYRLLQKRNKGGVEKAAGGAKCGKSHIFLAAYSSISQESTIY